MTVVRGASSSALSVVVCLACIACGAVDAFVGPMSAARSSLTRVNNNKQVASVGYSRAPQGCFTGTSAVVALDNSRARLLRTAAGSSGVSMMAGSAKKTAIITGASSGKLAARQRQTWGYRAIVGCQCHHMPSFSNYTERAEQTMVVVMGACVFPLLC